MPDAFSDLALFPLGTVLFPNNELPLRIFEPRYVDLVGRCMRDGTGFGVVGILAGREAGAAATPHEIGTLARIIDFDQGADGLLNIVIRGAERFRLHSTYTRDDELLIGNGEYLDELPTRDIPGQFAELRQLLATIAQHLDIAALQASLPDSAGDLAYALAQYLPLPVPTKVELLAQSDPVVVLARLAGAIAELEKK